MYVCMSVCNVYAECSVLAEDNIYDVMSVINNEYERESEIETASTDNHYNPNNPIFYLLVPVWSCCLSEAAISFVSDMMMVLLCVVLCCLRV